MLAGSHEERFQRIVPSFFEVNQSTGPPPQRLARAAPEDPPAAGVSRRVVSGAGKAAFILAEERERLGQP
jgi:hypothetical protein